MTCGNCREWGATTEAQRASRIHRQREHPDVGTYACPVCGGTDWVTTREMIEELPAPAHYDDRAPSDSFTVLIIAAVVVIAVITIYLSVH